MAHVFTSLRHPLEKLQEAEFFLAGVTASNGLEFQFNLNAFLAACRSTTLVLQKSMAKVPGFSSWYATRREEMRADAAMKFFMELRNISQKEGPISIVGALNSHADRWTYRFAGNREPVPLELEGVDLSRACADHLVKLAKVLLSCFRKFPFSSCPVRALTPQGMTELQFSLNDIGTALSLPNGFLAAGDDIPIRPKLRILAREFEPLDVEELERIARGDLRHKGAVLRFPEPTGSDLTDTRAAMVEDRVGGRFHPRNLFVEAVVKRTQDFERN